MLKIHLYISILAYSLYLISKIRSYSDGAIAIINGRKRRTFWQRLEILIKCFIPLINLFYLGSSIYIILISERKYLEFLKDGILRKEIDDEAIRDILK